MSFIQTPAAAGKAYAPGWFLADNENCERKTRTIRATFAYDGPNGGKYVKMGTVYPLNDATAEGFVFEDVDVTTGDMPGSVVLSGVVYLDRLPQEIEPAALNVLEGKFRFVETSPAVTRPYD